MSVIEISSQVGTASSARLSFLTTFGYCGARIETSNQFLPISILPCHDVPRTSDAQECPLGRRGQLRPPQAGLVQNEDLALLPKAEVCRSSFHQDLPQQHTSWRPHVDAITTPTVHISVHVTLDPVRNARVSHCEEPSVREERLARVIGHVERISETTHHQHSLASLCAHNSISPTHMVDALVRSVVPSP